jgi:heat shock protein HslJ
MKNTGIIVLAILMLIAIFLSACNSPGSQLEDKNWILTSYTVEGESREVLSDTLVTLSFDSEEKQLSGSAGCNLYGGGYEIAGSKLKAVEPFYMTEMYCGDERDRQEREFMELLKNVESYDVTGDKLRIDSSKGALNFRLE